MSQHLPPFQDLVIIGAGTSGIICALGAINYGLKVTLICRSHNDYTTSSLLTETIPSKTFSYCAHIAHTIKHANNFGLTANLSMIDLSKVNAYIKTIVQEFHKENELETFQQLGGSLITGSAKFIDNNSIMVNNVKISSKYFIIATGTREIHPRIPNLTRDNFITYKEIFTTNLPIGKLIILGGKAESLEIAQALARFGNKVTLIFNHGNLFTLEDPILIKKLIKILEQEGINFYFVDKIIAFYTQNNRKILVCKYNQEHKITIDGDHIINLQPNHPNIEELELINTQVKYTSAGIMVNNKLQTTQNNIFALGSVICSHFKSVHAIEHQANVILHNVVFKIPTKIMYKFIPRVINTDPQLVSAGLTNLTKFSKKDQSSLQVLKFDFKDIDAAIYQQKKHGGVTLICRNNKILGVSILGHIATEIINEYTLAMKLEIDLTAIAQNIHVYPSISQINKRLTHKIFKYNNSKPLYLEKAWLKLYRFWSKLPFTD